MKSIVVTASALALLATGALFAQDPPIQEPPIQEPPVQDEGQPLPPVDQDRPGQEKPGQEKQPGQPMEMPKPTKEHEFLKQLEGEWTATGEATMGPGEAKKKIEGTTSTRSLGGFWVVSEHKGQMEGMQGKEFVGIQTLGYDAEKRKYVGSWVDNMNGYMWKYEGTVDAGGKLLTLTTEGPCPQLGGKVVKFEETIEIKDKDTLVFTSKADINGQMVTVMTMTSKRRA